MVYLLDTLFRFAIVKSETSFSIRRVLDGFRQVMISDNLYKKGTINERMNDHTPYSSYNQRYLNWT